MNECMKETLLLIDGNSIINRAYYGLAGRNTMSAPDGTPTGALYAFLTIYLKYIQELNPTYVCACFDLKAPTFRHQEYKEYKATRKAMPPDLAVQIPILKEILDSLGVPRFEKEGFEADDLIGSLSAHSKRIGWDVFILSGDKDDLQLVDENITVLMPVTKSGMTTTDRYDTNAVMEKYGISPSQIIDLKAIMGDTSDNIPGVKGIGEKGALDLIKTYGSLDHIYDSLDQIKPAIAQKLKDSRDIAYTSLWLATIKQDIPVSDLIDDIPGKVMNPAEAYRILQRLGFKSIIQRLDLKSQSKETVEISSDDMTKMIPPVHKVPVEELVRILQKANLYHFSSDVTPTETNMDGYCNKELEIYSEKQDRGFVTFLPSESDYGLVDCGDKNVYQIEQSGYDSLFRHLEQSGIRLVSYECKPVLRNSSTVSTDLRIYDIAVAGYLLSQAEGKASLERITETCLGQVPVLPQMEDSGEGNRQQSLFEAPATNNSENEKKKKDRLAYQLTFLHRIAQVQYALLIERNMTYLAFQVEMPLVGILAEMEQVGFTIDQNVLLQLNQDFIEKTSNHEKNIYELAGTPFNINSPKQLGDILFRKLELPTGRKTQSGYSTDSDVLDMLYDKHPIISEIIQYRQLSKLRSTFVEGLSKNMDPRDFRVHTTFNQTLTATGRLSSSEPNLQNIPVKQEAGREIRKAFTAPKGMVLIDADYSQIELRLLAAFSQDPEMVEAFLNNDDIHTNTAEEIFDLPRAMITPAMRSAAKTVNFSIVYGISDFGLARDLGITVKEAHNYIKEYYHKYPHVKPYLETLVHQAYSKGYVETLFHRRRYIQEIKSANRNIKSFGERAAMNTPVQGTAADIIKIAMVLVTKRLKEKKCSARMILQVHDELILEVPDKEAEFASVILKEAMEGAVTLAVPLIAEVHTGDNWYSTK